MYQLYTISYRRMNLQKEPIFFIINYNQQLLDTEYITTNERSIH